MEKKMVINCAHCDARKVTEETLAAYESIIINSASVLVTPETKELLNRYGVTMNCANVQEMDADVEIVTLNGSSRITAADVVTGGRKYLTVNGSLEIEPDTAQMLEQYVGIKVNGSITCPESMSPWLAKAKVNGNITYYPDGAILLKRSAVIDRTFVLRAKERLYWAAKRLIMVDGNLDPAKLAAKGATFSSREAILTEGNAEELVPLIDEKTDLIIVPDGVSVILDDVEMGEMTVKKYGTKLYIIGDLKITEDSADVLETLEYLNVRGDARVPQELKALLMEKLTDISGDVVVPKKPKGRCISDKMSVRVSKWMLEQEPDGIEISDVMTVKIDEDIPKELILERLSITDVMTVKCAPEQEDVLSAVCEDVMSIGEDEDDSGIGGMIKSAMGGLGDLLSTKMVNASDYVM